MPYEQSKSTKRRYNIGAFHQRYFVGNGVDIGGKPDPMGQYVGVFPLMRSVRIWDLQDGDAQYMKGVDDASYDFVVSSHCLEHLHDPKQGLGNWIRIVKPGGYLVITVPDEDLYELGHWPSRFNHDHKHSFTIHKKSSWSPVSINVFELLASFTDVVEVEKIELVRDFFRDQLKAKNFDQTRTVVAECCIEFILRKRQNDQLTGD
ncbi:methyltransferase domain-containing protein [Facilibium subflavum]|uniref:methyltransferase domain-containing protein n=1 Tax=Facilibium subflavum TaxID=2219058 RepID=UPI000E64C9BC|nr:methyltransferase domain-containing protein [Facilibium subflavum]